jgi:hypothetical protein
MMESAAGADPEAFLTLDIFSGSDCTGDSLRTVNSTKATAAEWTPGAWRALSSDFRRLPAGAQSALFVSNVESTSETDFTVRFDDACVDKCTAPFFTDGFESSDTPKWSSNVH